MNNRVKETMLGAIVLAKGRSSAPLVSVVVVCKDNPGELEATLCSLLFAGLPADTEVVVVDGSLTRNCWLIAEKWGHSNADNRWSVCLLCLEPRGVYHAFNTALSMCRGHWVAFMNAGDVYLEGGFSRLFGRASDLGSSTRAVFGQAWVCSTRNESALSWLVPHPDTRDIRRWLKHMFPCHQSLLFSRDFARSNLYPETVGPYGDRQVMRAAMAASSPRHYVSAPVCVHYLDGISSRPPRLRQLIALLCSADFAPRERLALIVNWLLSPVWSLRPFWMIARVKWLGRVCR